MSSKAILINKWDAIRMQVSPQIKIGDGHWLKAQYLHRRIGQPCGNGSIAKVAPDVHHVATCFIETIEPIAALSAKFTHELAHHHVLSVLMQLHVNTMQTDFIPLADVHVGEYVARSETVDTTRDRTNKIGRPAMHELMRRLGHAARAGVTRAPTSFKGHTLLCCSSRYSRRKTLR